MRNPRLAARLGYLALASADSYLAGRDSKAARRARFLTKPLLMPVLGATTHLAARGRDGGLLRGVQAAQVASWQGDLALLGKSRSSFLAGVGAFFVAHVAYIGAFATRQDPDARLGDPGPRAGATAWLAGAPLMALAAGRKDPTMRIPIAAYSAILATMFVTSTTLGPALPTSARRRIMAGTTLFLLSDSLLGVQKFLRKEPSPTLESGVMATYTTGQWLIAEGAAAAARAR